MTSHSVMITITPTAHQTMITVPVNEEVILVLPENPGTGGTSPSRATMLTPPSATYEPGAAPGSGGTRTFTSGERGGGHCVVCIGFDDTKRAWLCKISRGTRWCENGFFWNGTCGIDASRWAVESITRTHTIGRRRAARH